MKVKEIHSKVCVFAILILSNVAGTNMFNLTLLLWYLTEIEEACITIWYNFRLSSRQEISPSTVSSDLSPGYENAFMLHFSYFCLKITLFYENREKIICSKNLKISGYERQLESKFTRHTCISSSVTYSLIWIIQQHCTTQKIVFVHIPQEDWGTYHSVE
jgi:hypothetical protein